MSDRHLCKAKRTDNGEWVVWNVLSGIPHDISISDNTICQCTGLSDKNGELIWENDICIIHDSSIDEEDGYFTVEWDDDGARFTLEGDGLTADFDSYHGYQCEVIGSAIDNPELLEEQDE